MSVTEREPRVVDNPGEQRYKLLVGDELAGVIEYETEPGVVVVALPGPAGLVDVLQRSTHGAASWYRSANMRVVVVPQVPCSLAGREPCSKQATILERRVDDESFGRLRSA